MSDEQMAHDPVARQGVQRLEHEMSDFREEVRSSLDNMRHEVSEGFKHINARMDSDSRASRPQTIGIIAGIVGVISLAFAFTGLVTNPIRANIERIYDALSGIHQAENARLNELPAAYEQFGRNSAIVESHSLALGDLRARIHTIEAQTSRSEADRAAMRKHIDAIDTGGSRRWIATDTP